MSIAANRYAKALLDLAVADHAVDAYNEELTAVSQIVGTNSGLRAFLHSPRKAPATKKALLTAAFGAKIRKNTLHLLLLLLDKGRIDELPDICSAFARISDEYRAILNITVISPLPLDRSQLESIGEKFKRLYQAAGVRMTEKTDVSLIGGVKVTIGDKLYDGTVKGRLSRMKSALSGQ